MKNSFRSLLWQERAVKIVRQWAKNRFTPWRKNDHMLVISCVTEKYLMYKKDKDSFLTKRDSKHDFDIILFIDINPLQGFLSQKSSLLLEQFRCIFRYEKIEVWERVPVDYDDVLPLRFEGISKKVFLQNSDNRTSFAHFFQKDNLEKVFPFWKMEHGVWTASLFVDGFLRGTGSAYDTSIYAGCERAVQSALFDVRFKPLSPFEEDGAVISLSFSEDIFVPLFMEINEIVSPSVVYVYEGKKLSVVPPSTTFFTDEPSLLAHLSHYLALPRDKVSSSRLYALPSTSFAYSLGYGFSEYVTRITSQALSVDDMTSFFLRQCDEDGFFPSRVFATDKRVSFVDWGLVAVGFHGISLYAFSLDDASLIKKLTPMYKYLCCVHSYVRRPNFSFYLKETALLFSDNEMVSKVKNDWEFLFSETLHVSGEGAPLHLQHALSLCKSNMTLHESEYTERVAAEAVKIFDTIVKEHKDFELALFVDLVPLLSFLYKRKDDIRIKKTRDRIFNFYLAMQNSNGSFSVSYKRRDSHVRGTAKIAEALVRSGLINISSEPILRTLAYIGSLQYTEDWIPFLSAHALEKVRGGIRQSELDSSVWMDGLGHVYALLAYGKIYRN